MASLLKPNDLKSAYGISKSTAAKLRREGGGPAYIRVGRAIYYRPADLEAWLESLRVTRPDDECRAGQPAAGGSVG
jgi:hypothetical protein